MKSILFSFFILSFTANISARQVQLSYYLPADVTYNSDIPVPSDILGYEVGEWHATHDAVVNYMKALADASDRVTLTEYARSYEQRPLLLLVITSPENHARIESIKENQRRLSLADQSESLDIDSMPVIVNLGYSVHGNEPSGVNAALLSAYHYTAATGSEMEALLESAVILIDPALNPDGVNRFASWVNMHKSFTAVTDPASREFHEVWPNGRTNHYWFDLNRDWMPVVHPESRGRVNMFHEWRPNVLTDHHEMGTNSTYFFQPGIPSRTHPLTPQINQDLTAAIAEYHADYLDEVQALYYARESFDDFYYGKGSTYPDAFGTVGILFEQASSRGHAQESVRGVVSFPFTIRNQFLTSLSTVEAAYNLRTDLHEYRRSVYRDVKAETGRLSTRAYVIGDRFDRGRNFHFADLMSHHSVEFYELARDIEAGGVRFEAGRAFVIPTDQPEYKFIEAMFETRTEFTDSLFYDVSTWTLPYAFNLPHAELGRREFSSSLLGERIITPTLPEGSFSGGRSNYAYLFNWDEYYAPRTLYRLQQLGVRTSVASRPLTAHTATGLREFRYGAILVPLGIQEVSEELIYQTLQTAAREDGVDIYSVTRGLAAAGIDLGSPNMNVLEKPSVAILAGSGISNLEVGEIWHQLDQRYQIPLTIIDKHRFGGVDLSRYNTIIMVNGNYSDLPDAVAESLRDWIRNGGNLILQRSAINWARNQNLIRTELKEREPLTFSDSLTYEEVRAARGAHVIGGSIFHARLDLTHPLAYGYRNHDLKIFKNSTLFLEAPSNRTASPLILTSEPLASGYISGYNLELAADTPSVIVSSLGRGRIISFVDNPNFRAFWYGKNKLFANALFFGSTIDGMSTE
ncbi:MAG: zinc carboxypeptidase [Balneolaceae bacterium]|nr:MAG: zinc carboxypeptidase [Balneolaceae bacterium]